MPTDWIHHPWDAPASVLRSAGVELGFNYPKPIIEIDKARENLIEAVCLMQGKADTNSTDEVVVDNSETVRISSVSNVVLNEKPSCIAASSRDQRVPSMHIKDNNSLPNGKRPRDDVEDREPGLKLNACVGNSEASSFHEEDMCSTADSSSTKKQATSSFSFCVPHAYSVSSKGKESLNCESSEVKQPLKEHVEEE